MPILIIAISRAPTKLDNVRILEATAFVIEVYDEIVAPFFADNSRSVENVSVLNATDGL